MIRTPFQKSAYGPAYMYLHVPEFQIINNN